MKKLPMATTITTTTQISAIAPAPMPSVDSLEEIGAVEGTTDVAVPDEVVDV
jgi:hypothetical protein